MFYTVDIIYYVQPLVPLVLGLVLLFLLIKQSLIRKQFLKGRLIFTFLIVLCCALILAFYSELTKSGKIEIIQWYLFGLDVIIGILFIIFCNISSSREQFNKDLFLTLDTSKFYVLVDSKNRIKEISTRFLNDLDLKETDVYKKNLFDTIERKYQIFKLNGAEVSLVDLNVYFRSSQTQETTLNLEIHDEHGDISAYYFNQRPIQFLGKLRGRIFIGDKKGSEQLVGMEKNLVESTTELEMLQNRFSCILEKAKEGIFFYDLTNKNIWINDVLKQKLCLNYNDLSIDEFMQNIHPEDLAMYQEKHASINNINPRYTLSYRYNTGSRAIYVKEEGTRITNGRTVELCGYIRPIEGQKADKADVFLSRVLGEPEMLDGMNRLYKEKQVFQVVLIKLTSIDKTNEEQGRDFGDMIISEYIKWIKNRYVDVNLIYRISGLEFVAVIIDYRKMERLKNDLASDEKILHMNVQYGTAKTKVEAVMAIVYSTDAKDAKDSLKKAKDTLRICSKEQYSRNYAYYKDLR
ncbi:MAG: PAS domain-containing protein [Roseburia sp.]|nr:PAS domain-containing protein [Anaeroplasma bactoclasticum]MCM1196543.1 PAS domain-containing protein [Roseburia sp.]MCM1557633.1 PAS domain-containing protein [Anaeroplasma bactoclasticum]